MVVCFFVVGCLLFLISVVAWLFVVGGLMFECVLSLSLSWLLLLIAACFATLKRKETGGCLMASQPTPPNVPPSEIRV